MNAPDQAESSASTFERLKKIVESGYRNKRRYRIAGLAFHGLALFAGGLFLLILLESFLYLSPIFKFILAGIAFLLGIGWMIYGYRNQSPDPFRQFYLQFTGQCNLPELRYALDLNLYERDSTLRLHHAAVEQNLRSLNPDRLRSDMDRFLSKSPARRKLKRGGSMMLMGLAGIILAASLQPEALKRSALLWKAYKKPNPFSFTVAPGDTTLEQGTRFIPEVRFEDALPEEVELYIKTEVEEKFRIRPMNFEGRTFSADPITLNSNARYYVAMDGFETNRYHVNVQLRPRFDALTLNIIPPPYTNLDQKELQYPFSQVRAYQGSRITLSGSVNKELRSLQLLSSDGDSTRITLSDRSFHHALSWGGRDTLQFSMIDHSGLTNNNRFEFILEPLNDEYPFVQILNPEQDLEMSQPETVELSYEASDDFGLRSASLHYEMSRAFVEQPERGSISLGKPAINDTEIYSWDLAALGAKPRDVITYWIRVSDNDTYNGSKTSISRKLTIRFPSLAENLESLEERETGVEESLDNVSDSYEQMRREYDRFKEQLKENPQTDYRQQQSLQEVKEQQQQVEEQLKKLNESFEEIRREMNQNSNMSEETLKAYEELEQLMREIDDPELLKAIEEMQKAMEGLDQQQLRKALENFEFKEEVYRERLKRTMELFKTLKLNSDLDKLAQGLEDLARQEQQLSEQKSTNEEQAEQQEAIREDTERLSDQVDKLSDNPPEDMQNQLQQLQQELDQQMDSVQQQIDQNIENLNRQGGGQQKSLQQQKIGEQLQQMAQQARNSMKRMNQNRIRVNIAALNSILYSLINLSLEQEELTRETESLANRSQAFVDKARAEKNISRQFTQIADSLFSVSSEIPRFPNQVNRKKQEVGKNLSKAVDQLAERNKSNATFAQRQSMGGINELASMVASLLEQLQNQNGQSGGAMTMQQFQQQMQNMSGQQQQLNQQIQQMINDIQGDRLTRDQIGRLNQMAKQQNRIRKQLEEMQRSGNLEAGDKILSELERISEEMESTINDLRGGETNPDIYRKRQQNILSRMLNAEDALQQRDKEEKREGTTAEDSPRSIPPDVTLEELQKQIRSLLNDPDKTRFTEDYQRLIEQYFELLRRQRPNSDS